MKGLALFGWSPVDYLRMLMLMLTVPDSRVQEAPNVALSACQLELLPTACGPDSCAQGTLLLTATTDFTRDGNRASLVTPQPTRGSPRLWRSYRPDPLKVSTCDVILILFLYSLLLILRVNCGRSVLCELM